MGQVAVDVYLFPTSGKCCHKMHFIFVFFNKIQNGVFESLIEVCKGKACFDGFVFDLVLYLLLLLSNVFQNFFFVFFCVFFFFVHFKK